MWRETHVFTVGCIDCLYVGVFLSFFLSVHLFHFFFLPVEGFYFPFFFNSSLSFFFILQVCTSGREPAPSGESPAR